MLAAHCHWCAAHSPPASCLPPRSLLLVSSTVAEIMRGAFVFLWCTHHHVRPHHEDYVVVVTAHQKLKNIWEWLIFLLPATSRRRIKSYEENYIYSFLPPPIKVNKPYSTHAVCQTTTICIAYPNFHMSDANQPFIWYHQRRGTISDSSSFNSIDLLSYDKSFCPVYARPE